MRKIISVPSYGIIFMTIIFGLGLVACAQTSGQAPSHQAPLPTQAPSHQRILPTQVSSQQGTLSGILLSGPTCPGPTTERPGCADQPVPHLQIEIQTPNGQVRTTITTDQHGHFSVMLPAGSYLLTARFGIRGQQSTSVKVAAGQTTTVQITLDTGIR